MGLFDFFTKPKWKNSNSQVRLKAVENMSVDELETLLEIIREDSDRRVRLAALIKVNDRESMELLLQEALPEEILAAARVKLEEIYTDLIISETDERVAVELLALIENQVALADIVARTESVTVRCQAVAAIDDPRLLCDLLQQHIGKKPALAAVEKIDDPQMLAEIADKAINKSARSKAAEKLKPVVVEEVPDTEDSQTVLEQEKQEQAEQKALKEAKAREEERGREEEERLKKENVIADELKKKQELELKIEREKKEAERQEKEKKKEQEKEKEAEKARIEKETDETISDICLEMEKLAAASYHVQAEKESRKLSESWRKVLKNTEKQYVDFVARFQVASSAFWEKKEQFYKEQEWHQWNNKTQKEELCSLVELLKEDNDLHQVATKLKEYQAAWKQIGSVHKKYSQGLWERFKSSCDENYARCREFYAELDLKRQDSLVVKEELCVKAEEHVASTEWKDSSEFLQGLQKEWKEAGPAVRDKDQALYERFKKACDQFFERRNAIYAEQDAERKDNLLAKEKLCQDVEDLLQEPKREHGKAIQELQKKWKEIGPVPRKDDQKIWKRFRAACDSFYNWLDEQREDNLKKKILLCEQVEALLPENPDDELSKETVDRVVELQKEWKTIGPVPRKDDDAVWERFTSQCDTFFVARKIQAQEDENKRLENQSLKETLLQKAGEVIQQQDEKEITVGLQELQKEWKDIGPAPREQDQLLWDEFQSLCNAFFQQKADRFQDKKVVLEKNLKKKEELCLQLERVTGIEQNLETGENEKALDLIEQFKIARETNFLMAGKTGNAQTKKEEVLRIQQEWKALGPTFREHEQRLWRRYRKTIDLFFSK